MSSSLNEKGERVNYEDITDFKGCTKVHECTRDDCFWRLRDVFGHGVWWAPSSGKPPWADRVEKALAGRQMHFPEFKVISGTNYLGIGCPSFQKK